MHAKEPALLIEGPDDGSLRHVLDQVDINISEVVANIDHAEAQYNPWGLQALRTAEALREAVDRVLMSDDIDDRTRRLLETLINEGLRS